MNKDTFTELGKEASSVHHGDLARGFLKLRRNSKEQHQGRRHQDLKSRSPSIVYMVLCFQSFTQYSRALQREKEEKCAAQSGLELLNKPKKVKVRLQQPPGH